MKLEYCGVIKKEIIKNGDYMSKKVAYEFFGTMGDIMDVIKNLPPAPTQAWMQDWKEFISEKVQKQIDHREFYHKITQLRVRFDYAKEGAKGFKAIDHWHIYNPYTKNKLDVYLDKNGNPVKDGSGPSHIIPKKDEET